MTTQQRGLTERQLAWCREKLPGFATHHDAVLRRDAEVAENWRLFHPEKPEKGCE